MDGSDVSVPQTQRTLTDASTVQLQVHFPPPGSVRSSQSFPVTVPAEHTETAARTSSNGWFDSAGYAGYCTTSTTGSIHPPPMYPHKRLHLRRLLHYHPHPHFLRSRRICVLESHQSADVDRCCPPYTESTTVDLKTKL